MKRQTCANNEFLWGVKASTTPRVYARTVKLLNTKGGDLSGGLTQSVTYLQQFYNKPITAQYFVRFAWWLKHGGLKPR